jgi:hypothetical protein
VARQIPQLDQTVVDAVEDLLSTPLAVRCTRALIGRTSRVTNEPFDQTVLSEPESKGRPTF